MKLQPNPEVPVCSHRGDAVRVGGFRVFLGGAMYLKPAEDLPGKFDTVIPFVKTSRQRIISLQEMLRPTEIYHYPIQDFSGVPNDWFHFLTQVVVRLMRGRKVMAFCMGGHGRTGTFLASLIAMLEPGVKDPIAAARRRYCAQAVETVKQAEAVFALRGKPLPVKYQKPR